MKKLSMNKIITVLADGFIPHIVQVGKLDVELASDIEVEACYPQGMKASRERILAKLGYTLKTAICTPCPKADPIWSEVRGIWHKAA